MNTSKNNITIHGHHIEITPPLEETVINMVNKLQQKCDQITQIKVNLRIDSSSTPHLQEAEAELMLKGKQKIFAKVSNHNMYNSIHDLKFKLERQIIKYKETKQ